MEPKLPGANCESCPGRDHPAIRPQRPTGKVRLAIVGDGPPHRNDIEENRPLGGGPGRLLDRGLQANGIRRGDCHVTFAVPCQVKEAEIPAARKCCETRLHAELASAMPRLVLALGAVALQSCLRKTGKPQILRWRGSINPISLGDTSNPQPTAWPDMARHGGAGQGTLLLPSIHPSFVMRAPAWAPTFQIDVNRAGRYVAGQEFVPPEEAPGRKTLIARTESELHNGLDELYGARELAFDVETVGLGPTSTALVCFALSDGETTLVVPWSKGRDGAEPWWFDSQSVAAQVSAKMVGTTIVTHNGPAFDHIVARRYGLEIRRWEDTLLAGWATASHMPRGLSAMVQTHLDVDAWKEREDRTATINRLHIYNARDTLRTRLLWDCIKGQVAA